MNHLFDTNIPAHPPVVYPSLSPPPPVRPCSPQSFVEVELIPLTKEDQGWNHSDPTPEEEREKHRIETLIAFYASIYDDLSLSKQINAGLLALLVLIEWAIYSFLK